MSNRSSFIYLNKILMGLALLAIACFSAFLLPQITLAPTPRAALIAIICFIFIGFLVWAWRQQQRSDELRQLINARSCVAALGILATCSAIVGVLQLQGYLVMFNQLWTFLLALVIWALCLMLADRPFQLESDE